MRVDYTQKILWTKLDNLSKICGFAGDIYDVVSNRNSIRIVAWSFYYDE